MPKKPVKNKGGRPSVKMPCGWGCGADLGVAEMRKHIKECPNRKLSTVDNPTTTLSAAPAGSSTTIVVGGPVDPEAPILYVDAENPTAVEFERLLREGGATIVDVTHAPQALEHAARAEAPIGKSVTEFLLENPPKVGEKSTVDNPGYTVTIEPGEAVETYQQKCLADFGVKVMAQAARSVPRWDRMSWGQRHEFLKAQQESQW